jgi:hypothetical protein
MDKAVRVTKMEMITRRFEQRKDKTVDVYGHVWTLLTTRWYQYKHDMELLVLHMYQSFKYGTV